MEALPRGQMLAPANGVRAEQPPAADPAHGLHLGGWDELETLHVGMGSSTPTATRLPLPS